VTVTAENCYTFQSEVVYSYAIVCI